MSRRDWGTWPHWMLVVGFAVVGSVLGVRVYDHHAGAEERETLYNTGIRTGQAEVCMALACEEGDNAVHFDGERCLCWDLSKSRHPPEPHTHDF